MVTTETITNTLEVIDITTGKKIEDVEVPQNIRKYFDYDKNTKALLHELVVAYHANQRQGTHSTKTRAEVRGGGRKPWRQKHTGRARSGSIRSPLWRKGGIVFGPKPRDYYISIPKQKKVVGKYVSLVDKIKNNNLIVVNNLDLQSYKTKDFIKILKNLNLDSQKVLVVDKQISNNLKLSSRNLQRIFLCRVLDLNAYDILNCNKIVITKEALLCL
jgi:large subunit ribosomal protein L4